MSAGKKLVELFGQTRLKGTRYHALAGDADGVMDVPGRPGYKYARVPKGGTGTYLVGQFIGGVNTANVPVEIEQDPFTGQNKIQGTDGTALGYAGFTGDPQIYQMTAHSLTHELGGNDQSYFSTLQLYPLQTSPGLTARHVTVGVGQFVINNVIYFKTTSEDVDLSSYYPTSGYKFVWLTLNTAGTVVVVDDSQTSYSTVTLPVTSNFVLCCVVLSASNQYVAWGSFIDARFWVNQAHHTILSTTHTGTTPASIVDGDLLIGNSGNVLTRLAISVPGANVLNYIGVNNGEVRPSWKSASASPGAAAAILQSNSTGGLTLAGNLVVATVNGNVITTGTGTLTIAAGKTLSIEDTMAILPTGAADTNVLTYDSASGKWIPGAGGSGTPGGLDTQIQFNDGGAFGGHADMAFDKTLEKIRFGASASPLSDAGGAGVSLIGDGRAFSLNVETYGTNTPAVSGAAATGSVASPTAALLDRVLMRVSGRGYGTTEFPSASRARIDLVASENQTDTANGTRIELWTTPVTTATIAKQVSVDDTGTWITSGVVGTATAVPFQIKTNSLEAVYIGVSTAIAGNARGAQAIELLISRVNATQVASGAGATSVGGYDNTVSGVSATNVGGGSNVVSGLAATNVGGGGNTASGANATTIGGGGNVADSTCSLAMGLYAKTNAKDGAFVWADYSGFDFLASAANEFAARATGGVRFVTAIDGAGAATYQAAVGTTAIITAKKVGAAGIALDPNGKTGDFALLLSPTNLTGNRRVTFPDAALTFSDGGTLALGGFTATIPATGTVALGTGTATRLAVWSDANTLAAGTVVQPAANVLTLTNAAASTLALAITAGKTLTLTAANDYNLTVPATGTAALITSGTTVVTLTCTTGTITLAAATQTLSWVKIGTVVFVSGYLGVNAISSPTGTLTLNNLPFAVANAAEYYSAGAVRGNILGTAATQILGFAIINTTTMRIQKFATGAISDMAADVTATSTFVIQMTYFTP